MPKVRRSKNRRPAGPISRREVPTPGLLVLGLEDEVTDEMVKGRFVKLAPRLRPSQRSQWDGAAEARRLRKAGALGVTIAPVLIPEVTRAKAEKAEKAEGHMNPRDHVKAWLASTHLSDDERAIVLGMVEGFMSEEGL